MKSTTKEKNSGLQHLDSIITDIDALINSKQDFIAFIVIALGIEFMGSFYDDKEFNDFGQSEIRFKNAICNLFKNKWYKNNVDWMFRNFRGPLIHQYRPGDNILLTSYCKNKAELNLHLTNVDGKKVFILEQLFIDFKLAIQKLKNEFKKPSNPLNKRKINDDFMAIVRIHVYDEDKVFGQDMNIPVSSGTTAYSKTLTKNKKIQSSDSFPK